MKSGELRKKFFDFFIRYNHEKIASSSLIPTQDPTLLFTNAGMNQFKDIFLGKEKRSYKRAVSIQKCVRAGGKHNDLDNVGFTQRHLTFFEMMGNFSFGDYFKKEAILYAWQFLTEEVKFDKKDLYITVHHSDQQTYNIWNQEIGIPHHKIFKLGADNFWQMGDTGPCGPCTEIFVDRGPRFGCKKNDCSPACGCDRFIEVWNNVFMQFNRQPDGTDIPLKQTGVDTGMGLERLTMLIQKRESVFDTDLFKPIFDKIEALTNFSYSTASAEIKAAFNVLGDHIRSSTFLIADGCAPANDGRGYVLRKIIRRAALFTQKLTSKNIFPSLAITVIDTMSDFYPELNNQKDRIVSVLTIEIDRFTDNLVRGKKILQEYIDQHSTQKLISGSQAFMLYDTYGFPLEVTALIAKEHGFVVNTSEFEQQMQEQRKKSGKKMKEAAVNAQVGNLPATLFTGYERLQEQAKIIKIIINNHPIDSALKETECWIAVDKSPFYVESGGQVSDRGSILINNHHIDLLELKKIDQTVLIKIKPPIDIKVGDLISMNVDKQNRNLTMKNHTATHLLQAALQQLLGKQIKQAGSMVTPDYLRFDYTYHQPLTQDQIKEIEDTVNQKIWENLPVTVSQSSYKKAIEQDVIAFFGDKYNQDDVRIISIDNFSKELCGGTHVHATGEIGIFKIIEETSLATGQRRIVAYTGAKALATFQQTFSLSKKLCLDLKTKSEQIVDSVLQLQTKIKDLNKDLLQLKKEQIISALPQWLEKAEIINNISYLFLPLYEKNLDEMREIAQMLNQKKAGFYFLIQKSNNKTIFLILLDKDLAKSISLKELQVILQKKCMLVGGGSTTTLQGGGAEVDPATCNNVVKDFLKK